MEARMIRVNQAGEHGAGRIYAGQRAVLGDSSVGPALAHMEAQERGHQAMFDRLLVQHRIRPTALGPLWHGLGYGLGVVSALMGKRAAMAATVAVEEVIEAHYEAQLQELAGKAGSEELVAVIQQCKADEVMHKETALELEARQMKGYGPFTAAVRAASRAAIWLSSRI